MFHTPAHKSGTAGQVRVATSAEIARAEHIPGVKERDSEPRKQWRIQVQFGGHWFDLIPTDGRQYTYDSEEEAKAIIAAFLAGFGQRYRAVLN